MPVTATDAPIILLSTRLNRSGQTVSTWRDHQGRRINFTHAPGTGDEQGLAHARQFLHTRRQEAITRVRHV